MRTASTGLTRTRKRGINSNKGITIDIGDEEMRSGKRKSAWNDEGDSPFVTIVMIALVTILLIVPYIMPITKYINDGEFETIIFDDLDVYIYRGNIYTAPSSILVDENDWKDAGEDYFMLVFNNDGTYKISIDGEEYETKKVSTGGFLSTDNELKILETDYPTLFNSSDSEIKILETTHNIEETHTMEWVLR